MREGVGHVEQLDSLGDEIAELSAHLEAATGRLLDLIREFDARGGWNTGFRSCAAWLAWRVGLCRRHHRAVHEEGYQVHRQADGTFRFHRPDGRSLPEVPPRVQVPADPVGELRARHVARGLRLDPRTACPGWLGERLDV